MVDMEWMDWRKREQMSVLNRAQLVEKNRGKQKQIRPNEMKNLKIN